MGTVAIGIGIGIGIGLGSVETVLHIFIEANFIGIGIGVDIGIGVGQWKHISWFAYQSTDGFYGVFPLSDSDSYSDSYSNLDGYCT